MATNGTDTPKRDTRNHVLFEVATEVANRGLALSLCYFVIVYALIFSDFLLLSFGLSQWEESIRC